MFARSLEDNGQLRRVARVVIQLYGSLGTTGKGHGSDKAVLLGLSGHEPDTVDVDGVPALLEEIRQAGRLRLGGTHALPFDEARDLVFFRTSHGHCTPTACASWRSTTPMPRSMPPPATRSEAASR